MLSFLRDGMCCVCGLMDNDNKRQAIHQPINPLAAKLFNWNFHPLEVVYR